MKKLFSLALILLFSASAMAQESSINQTTTKTPQAEPSKKNFLFRLEPTYLLFNQLDLDFQFRISDHFTLGPTLSYMNNGSGVYYGTMVSTRLFYNDRTNREGFGLRGSYYFEGVGRKSAYIGAFGKYRSNKITGESGSSSLFSDNRLTSKGQFNETVAGITGGYQWVWGLFALNVGGGVASYNHPDKFTVEYSDGTTSQYSLSDSPISYTIDIGVGMIF